LTIHDDLSRRHNARSKNGARATIANNVLMKDRRR
jgi:hypothetical protein